ncbi:hypothetical protein ASPZODRAFT_133698 [Penicilliopsis zonata CBS 506.65]|uniref:FYVE-type domain-containing protein n=1 Tax=Penicilliopsis zonata CBS 506.65 TaxID=1073090 RepID=A0A1L9SFN5_9EURO|nr:hypothetical protein ASPZODRAFT_133698 [Penicilliopsis zonata CBS 506.65]OJJ45834.1 hypothetical protein ASPZODRAFT_133698 [Penicilliopsis zonata CBS 506.65]
MATQVQTFPASQQIAIYGHPSPTNSANTTANNSPTSPQLTHALPLQSRQLRPPKAPLYVPAALRPTERPQRTSPPTPPRSVNGSLDSLNNNNNNTESDLVEQHQHQHHQHHQHSQKQQKPQRQPLSRRSTIESTTATTITKLAEDEWMKLEHLGEVTGLPTRDHWKADSVSPTCDSPNCRSSFGLFVRRHHCRHCGHVFCAAHTPHTVPLDQDASFHPEGTPSRACDLCLSAFHRWQETRSIRLYEIQSQIDMQRDRDLSADENNTDSEGSVASSANDDGSTALDRALARRGELQGPPEVAASIPRDWHWSTF